jgi:hypothetical protein
VSILPPSEPTALPQGLSCTVLDAVTSVHLCDGTVLAVSASEAVFASARGFAEGERVRVRPVRAGPPALDLTVGTQHFDGKLYRHVCELRHHLTVDELWEWLP